MNPEYIRWLYNEHNCVSVIPEIVFRVYPSLRYLLEEEK